MNNYIVVLALLCISNFIYSQNSKIFYDLANEKYDKGDYRGTIQDCTKAIELNDFPKIDERNLENLVENTYYLRALAKEQIKDYAGRIADLTKAIDLNKKSAAIIGVIIHNKFLLYRARGFEKYRLGDFRSALSDFDVAMTVKDYERDPTTLYYKGLTYDSLKDYKSALKYYQDAEFHYKENRRPNLYYYMGIVKIKLGQKVEGCKDLSTAGELGDKDAYEIIRQRCN